MEMHEIQKKDDKELYGELKELSEKLAELRHQAANGKLTEVHTISRAKKTIARIETELTQRKKQQNQPTKQQ